jgi:bacillithiol system protein YtxJ
MNWIIIDSADKIYEAEDLSQSERVLIFKYSHSSGISYVMKMLLQREWHEGEMKMKTYLLNIADNPDLSNDISQRFKVEHETPQVIILEKGKCISNLINGKVLFANLREFAN